MHSMRAFRKKETRIADEGRKMRRRIELVRSATKTRKGLMPTMISCYGLKRNANSAMIQSVITLDDLFQ